MKKKTSISVVGKASCCCKKKSSKSEDGCCQNKKVVVKKISDDYKVSYQDLNLSKHFSFEANIPTPFTEPAILQTNLNLCFANYAKPPDRQIDRVILFQEFLI
jgi:hypothetical protein